MTGVRLFAAILGGLCVAAQARVVEEVVLVPVTVQAADGREVRHPIVVTLFRDDALPAPHPVAVIGHGRSGNARARAAMGRARYAANAHWFARLGFLVAVPTRIGYGETGGEDVENTGPCGRKNYPPGYAAAADQLLATLAAVRLRPDASASRGIVLGQSYGGAAAIAVAARSNVRGIQAVVNFAGGGGGDPVGAPRQPCQPERLARMFADFGATSQVPTLWVYAENDLYFGAEHPVRWHAAFRDRGGRGDLVQFPPQGEDGHGLFTLAPQVWRPTVLAFLRAHGFPAVEPAR